MSDAKPPPPMRWFSQLVPLVAGLALVLPASAQAGLQVQTLEVRAGTPALASGPYRVAGGATLAPVVSGDVTVWAVIRAVPGGLAPAATDPDGPALERGPAPALSAALPTEVALRAVYPNPLVSSARVPYELPAAGVVRLAVYDALGRQVAVLADGDRPAGFHEAPLDAARLAPGVYHVRLTAGPFVGAARFTVVR